MGTSIYTVLMLSQDYTAHTFTVLRLAQDYTTSG